MDSYVLVNFVKPFVFSIISFVIIMTVSGFLNNLNYYLSHKVLDTNLSAVLKFHIYSMPFMFQLLVPISVLFGVTYSLSKMARQKELISFIEAGVSIRRITASIVLFNVIFAFSLVYFSDYVVSPLYKQAQWIEKVKIRKFFNADNIKDQKDLTIFGEGGLIYRIGYYDGDKKIMSDVTIIKRRGFSGSQSEFKSELDISILTNEDLRRTLESRELDVPYPSFIEMRIDADRAEWDSTSSNWVFYRVKIKKISPGGFVSSVERGDKMVFPFVKDPPYHFENNIWKIEAMNMKEAKRYVEKLKKSGFPYKEAEVRYYMKYSYPFAVFIASIVAIGIASFSPRKEVFFMSILKAVGIYFVYYGFFASGIGIGGKGLVHPIIGAWFGNFVFGVLGVILMTRMKT